MDQGVITFVETDVDGVVVAAQSHLDGPSPTPGGHAAVLGALRRAVSEVQSSYGTVDVTIQPISVPGHADQVGFHVQPIRGPDLPAATARAELARHLQQALVGPSGRGRRSPDAGRYDDGRILPPDVRRPPAVRPTDP